MSLSVTCDDGRFKHDDRLLFIIKLISINKYALFIFIFAKDNMVGIHLLKKLKLKLSRINTNESITLPPLASGSSQVLRGHKRVATVPYL